MNFKLGDTVKGIDRGSNSFGKVGKVAGFWSEGIVFDFCGGERQLL